MTLTLLVKCFKFPFQCFYRVFCLYGFSLDCEKSLKMIIVTGAAGFIGSCLVSKLNECGYDQLVLVDDFSRPDKERNFTGKKYQFKVEREDFFNWLSAHHQTVDFIFHLGARTDTTEFRKEIFDHLNLEYSKKVW